MAADEQSDHGATVVAGLAAGAGMAAILAEDDKVSDKNAEMESAGTATSAPPELRLGLDDLSIEEKSDEDDNLVTDEINLDELDLLLGDDSLPSGPAPLDDFQTEELDLADLEKILDGDVEETTTPQSPPILAADELDVFEEESEDSFAEDLDLDMDDLESLLNDDVDLGDGRDSSAQRDSTADKASDEVKLELVPELEDLLEDDDQDLGLEDTEEISLLEADDGTSGLSGAEVSTTNFDDDDIDLELAPGIESLFDEVEDQDVPLEETEEIDFSILGDDSEQMDQVAEETAEEPEAFELELDLDASPEAQPAMEEDDQAVTPSLAEEGNGTSDDEVEELDLDDLESLLEEGGAEPSKLSPGEEQPELVLELEGETEVPTGADDLNLLLDDLDLGAVDPSEQGEIDEALDLDIEAFESLLDGADAPSAKAPESEVLELDLDFDGDTGDAEQEPDDATRELNLDDIEKILESQESAPTASSIPDEAEDELDLDIVNDDAAHEADFNLLGEDETTDGSGALDLSELERMLDVEDTTDSPVLPADQATDDLDLDFELQPAIDEDDELKLEFDMLDDEGEEPSALFDTSESEDLGLDLDLDETPVPEKVELEEDLEFEIMDGGSERDLDDKEDDAGDSDLNILGDEAASATAPAEAAALGAAGAVASRDLTQELMDEMAAADTQTMEIPPAETKPGKSAPVPAKKKSNKLLLLLLLLVLLGAAGYFLYTAMGSDASKFKLSDLPQIPFVTAWLGGKKAPEAVVPVETALKGSWVQNKIDGSLYIIQGRVKNEYLQPRSYIRVTGRIFADGRKFNRVAHAYCGNMPSREDLENLPVADLQKVLGNRNGANDANVMVAPGKEVPFTVVFAGLPEDVDLQEYAVEISGSLPATKDKSQ